MNIKRFGIITGSIIGFIYIGFLLLPLIVNPILNSYVEQISSMVENSSGFKVKLEKIGLVTTPKLTVGIKLGKAELRLPTDESILNAENFSGKLSLLPILARKIEIDSVNCDSIDLTLKVQKDGHFLFEEFIPKPVSSDTATEAVQAPVSLPFGIKLSNHLPNITLKNYNISFIDIPTNKKYSLNGKDFKISDFILDKKIKLSSNGNFTFDNTEQFVYNFKLENNLMPNISLHEMVFNPTATNQTAVSQTPPIEFNLIDIFKSINKAQLTANLNADIKTSGTFKSPIINGNATIDNMSILVDGKKLPESSITFNSKGNFLTLDANLFSEVDEKTSLIGKFRTGKNPNIDMQLISNVKLNNLFRIINSIAKAFNYNDLETLSATGGINSNFTFKTDLKKLNTNGYFSIPNANINYALYNIAIENIKADIDLSNMLNIKNISLEILKQPLKIYGTIKENSDTDLHITADNLLIKGLIAAAGQVQVLKENQFNSGSISLHANIAGKLQALVPDVKFTVNNVDIKNIPTDTRITMPNAQLAINTVNNLFEGNITANNFKITNPIATLTIPDSKIIIGSKDIEITKADLLLNNSLIKIAGKITNYLTDKLNIDIEANGNIIAKDVLTMFPKETQYMFSGKGEIPLSAKVIGNLKSQEINAKLNANSDNYVSILNIDALKDKSTIINSNIKIADDTAKFTNTGIYANDLNTPIATLSGGINKLSKTQDLNLHLSVPKRLNIEIPGFKGSNLAVRGDVDITGNATNPYMKGLVSIPTITIPDMLLTMTNLVANLNGPILEGNGTLQAFKFGGIVAENLATKFALKNYSVFYLNNLVGDAFNGKINGNISYGLFDTKVTVDMTGSDMNALKAIEGAAGIKNALSGTLGFDCNIATKGVTDIEMMKNMTGKVTFDVKNGKFLNIGRFDNLLYAQNILGNAILKTAVTAITNTPIIQNTAEFKSIKGELLFNNGWADIKSITTSGPLMAYYITGKYNLLNATTNVIILGRLDSKVVSLLGPLGDLSVDKLTSYIPNFGALTGALINSMTSNPEKENTSMLPQLSSGSTEYKDFKVEFNGGLESTSSIKSFKWLTNCDTSAIDIKQDINSAVNAVKQDLQSTKDALKNSIQDSKQQLLDAKEELKNLFKF